MDGGGEHGKEQVAKTKELYVNCMQKGRRLGFLLFFSLLPHLFFCSFVVFRRGCTASAGLGTQAQLFGDAWEGAGIAWLVCTYLSLCCVPSALLVYAGNPSVESSDLHKALCRSDQL